MAESLKGKVAVITGVGSGFGKATAEKFAKTDQVDLVLVDHNQETLNATAELCMAPGYVRSQDPAMRLGIDLSVTACNNVGSRSP